MRSIYLIIIFSLFFISCKEEKINLGKENFNDEAIAGNNKELVVILNLDKKRKKIKLSHAINTQSNEYLPVCNFEGNKLYFSAMDRTGFFDFKLDYIKEKSAGGEDVFCSELLQGVWSDARPLSKLNTNSHEVVTQIFRNGDLLVTGNYSEKLGTKMDKDAGVQSTDLFFIRKMNSSYQINHLPEPINSIFTESDGFMSEDQSFILFVSDRNGNIGEYHKKGWKWNESYWGNTDVYVSIKEGDYWSVPINLGSKVNTPSAERTPWLSEDGLTLFLSSNGYLKGRTDLDVYAFKRKSINDWNNWMGPYSVTDANTEYDDWGYKETKEGDAFVSTVNKLNFKSTQAGAAGDGGIRETNFRPGYDLFGLQVASLNSEYESNIYQLKSNIKPDFIINDVYFDFDSFAINASFSKYLLLLIDQIKQNNFSLVEIHGHTDNVGNEKYNVELSLKRANAIKYFFQNNGINLKINTVGYGASKPIISNGKKTKNSLNRRVEIYLNNN